jgi:hypothetical protein
MWIILKLLLIPVILLASLPRVRRISTRSGADQLNGCTVIKDTGRARVTLIGVPLVTKYHAHFARETKFHRFLKALGFATEIQTGDHSFDARVYVTADHPMMMYRLSKDQELRRSIIQILRQPGASIFCDGKYMWLKLDGDADPSKWTNHARAIADRLSNFETRFANAFFVRALVIQGLTYLPLVYVLTGLPLTIGPARYPSPLDLIIPGLFITIAWAGAIFALARILLSGSSRAPKILIEAGVALLFSLPPAGYLAAYQLNQVLDRKDQVVVESRITSKQRQEGRRLTKFYATLNQPIAIDQEFFVPSKIEISQWLFDQIETGDTLRISVGNGFFGVPWYRDIELMEVSDKPNVKNP